MLTVIESRIILLVRIDIQKTKVEKFKGNETLGRMYGRRTRVRKVGSKNLLIRSIIVKR